MQGVEIWNKINESAKVIAWPGVVTFAIVLFRARLGELFQRVREAVTPAGSVRFDPSAQAVANLGITRSAGSLVETVKSEIHAAQTRGENLELDGEGDESAAKPPIDLSEIRDEINALITASFQAGFNAAPQAHRMGSGVFKAGLGPRPMISWEGSLPEVVGYSVHGVDRELPTSDAVEWFILRDQVTKDVAREMVLASQIAELRDQLASLDEGDSRINALRSDLWTAQGEQQRVQARLDETHERLRKLEARKAS